MPATQVATPTLPALEYAGWRDTKDTIHRWAQIVGKVRLALAPKRDHWWHVSLRPTPRGLSTGLIPHRSGGFEVEFDFVEHALDLRTSAGDRARIPLHDGLSVAEVHDRLFRALGEWGIRPRIRAVSYDLVPRLAFARDRRHATYDRDAAARFARVLWFSATALERFAGRFRGKSSPVHFFWHSFDLAMTRFSGRPAPALPGQTGVEREAYSDEVASFGFWPGDDDARAPVYYAYAAPVPDGLVDRPLRPKAATWLKDEGQAVLPYDVVRKSRDPEKTVLDFFESVFQAARRCADWDSAVASPLRTSRPRRR
jgi:hypothetical protein